jgi:hypothetical protein
MLIAAWQEKHMAFPPIRIEGIHLRLTTPTIIGVAAVAAMLIYALIKF